MDRLLDGYRQFRETLWPERQALFELLAERGQAPRAMMIACSDSRVDPGMIFGTAPGEVFVVRNVANLVPPYGPDGAYHGTSAAVEFAVRSLEVADIVVMGHAMCGGVRFLLEGGEDRTDFVGSWMHIAQAARARVLECRAVNPDLDPQTECEQETVRLSLANLRTFPWVAERERDGRLRLHGALFDIRSGILQRLGPDGRFEPVS
jgi:carbonic anhydrase